MYIINMATLDQSKFYKKAVDSVRSCNSRSQINTAKRIVNQYDSLSLAFCEVDDEYDHEYHMYILLAELQTIEKLLN